MKIDFENVIRGLSSKANSYYKDTDKLKGLVNRTIKLVNNNKELRSIFDDIRILTELTKDYMKGEYRDLSKNSIILVIIGLIYLVSPIDIIPDFLIGGFVDDAAVIAYILKKITTEISAYKAWKKDKDDIIEITIEDENSPE